MSINTAFVCSDILQEIQKDNHLVLLRCELRDALQSEPSSDKSFQLLIEKLVDLRDQLAQHFSDSLNDPIEVVPRLCEQADGLLRQRQDLCSEISQMANLADHCHDPTDQFLDLLFSRVTTLLDQFDQHESEENALIQQSMNEDIGTGD